MANPDSVGQNTQDSFGNYRVAWAVPVSVGTVANAAATMPILSGGLQGTGQVIIRRITVSNAANAAGASASNTDLASQLMNGSGTPPTSSTSWYDTAKNLGNLLGGGTQSGTNSLLTGLSGVNVGATQIPVSKQAPFHYTNAQPTTTPSAPSSPTFLSGSQPQLLAALLNKKA